jgi:hypothetical protein
MHQLLQNISVKYLPALFVAVCGITGSIAPANATLIIDINGSTVATDPSNTFAFFSGAVGSFNINTLTAVGVNALGYPDLLDVGATDISTSGSGSMILRFTETDLSGAAMQNFLSSFSAQLSSISVTRSIYLDPTNAGLESILLGSTTGTNAIFVSPPLPLSGLFSVTEEIDLQALAHGALLSSDDRVSEAPEPYSMAIIFAALLSLAGFGWFRRRFR